jgi:serine/threonine protein kinase/Flp pilus assembly protein TadD
MSVQFLQVKEIFLAAVEKTDPAERLALVRAACGGDDALIRQVQGLLDQHDQASSFLEAPPFPATEGKEGDAPAGAKAGANADAVPEAVDSRIGPYKLLQKLGEGGMGTVWVAEQLEPVKRRVALKVINPGMDSRRVIRRFEAERQALALMDHTNIAKVLDAGATSGGRPYFVMELVKGVPITKYCDELHLAVRERLDLFIAVCHAIQHAHQKGIIHRDIKPSNVLVAIQDGKPVPKIIDFGVAKALHQQLTDQSLYTEIGQVVGTLEYMSPEQAELSTLDIDTRADVYALGVLLYELLTGTTPLDRKRLKSAAYSEMLRIIKEEEPPKPSTRLSASKEMLASAAVQRRTEPARLTREVRGDLDWIVMRCLEKDRTRRYESASSLARDLERHVRDEPVDACPPSTAYQLRKFLRRRKRALAAAAVLAAAVLLAAGSLLWVVQDRAAQNAEQQHKRELLERDIDLALQEATDLEQRALALLEDNPFQCEATLAAAGSALKRADALAGSEAAALAPALEQRLAAMKTRLEDDDKDRRLLEQLEGAFLANAFTIIDGHLFNYGERAPAYRQAFAAYGIRVGQTAAEAAAARITSRPAPVAARLVSALQHWQTIPGVPASEKRWLSQVVAQADADPWRRQMRAAWERRDRAALQKLAQTSAVAQQPPATLLTLARFLEDLGAYADQAALLQRGQQAYPSDFWLNQELAAALWRRGSGSSAEALPFQTAAVALRPGSAAARSQLGWLLLGRGKIDEALAAFRKELELAPQAAQPHGDLGYALLQKADLPAALAEFHKAIAINPGYGWAHFELGDAQAVRGDYGAAVPAFQKAAELMPEDAFVRYTLASACLGAGHVQAYRRVCAEMVERSETTRDPYWAQRTLYAVTPSAASFADTSVLLPLAERSAAVWRMDVRLVAAVQYRAGNFTAALEKFKETAKILPLRPWDHFFLAMTHHRLGQRQKGREHFETAVRLLKGRYPWRERVESEALRQESAELLQIKETPGKPGAAAFRSSPLSPP